MGMSIGMEMTTEIVNHRL